VVGGIDDQWQADLADMHSRAGSNDGYKWLLVVVDTFSKFAWAVPVKTKSAGDMVKAFGQIFEKAAPRTPKKLQTDEGKEFYNSQVKTLLKSKGIHHFSSASDQKAACAERFNRTIKTKIETAINTTQNERWIDILDDLMEGYNNSEHRTIGMAPSKVTPDHTQQLWSKMYGESMANGSREEEKIAEGTKVRISNVKGVFDKGYYPNWSEQHFNIANIKSKPGGQQAQYYLKEFDGEPIRGAFYREEIQPITKNRYRIRVLRERGRQGRKEYFVEWIGWPSKYNSWITQDQLTAIKPHGERVA
jgi:L-rhamnose mutarotase